ncbi:hypothetical protein FHP05_06050 [Cerasibacillus terrae]|uniref:Uncharacterized protein n=1 Tax=Cerasibacillus terrae TaxID=2498845 RepID=A0A5C8NXJ7_9BACI|nr:hypothetical protein [Cerasibacillus terrae]TXL65683.1 hypothetical protein FHP05_06050 [Cerasibacillus terrae]
MIEIKREAGWADRLRKYKVILDEEEVGSIGPRGTFEYPINPGLHTLYLQIDWCRSEKLEFESQNNEILKFKCGGLSNFKFLTIIWYITFRRNRYLWIKQINS